MFAVSDWEEQKASWPVVTMLAPILILYLLQCQGVTVMAVSLQRLGCVCLLFRSFLWMDSAHAVLAGQTVPADRKTDGKRKGCKDCAEDLFGDSLDLSLFGE